jgi:hypothetical protein
VKRIPCSSNNIGAGTESGQGGITLIIARCYSKALSKENST